MGIQITLVIICVACALFFIGRKILAALSGKGQCNCSNCQTRACASCKASQDGRPLTEIRPDK